MLGINEHFIFTSNDKIIYLNVWSIEYFEGYIHVKPLLFLFTGLLDSPSTTPLPIKNKPVAFTAIMSSDATGLGTGQGIMFDQVITKVGGAYHTSHGNFIAPADGVYVFTLMAMTTAGKAEHLEFVRDGVTVVVMFVGASSSGTYTSSTGIITLSLSKGNEVWIRTPRASWHGTGELHGFTGALFTSFSGWRLA